jgi:hypothetical protein
MQERDRSTAAEDEKAPEKANAVSSAASESSASESRRRGGRNLQAQDSKIGASEVCKKTVDVDERGTDGGKGITRENRAMNKNKARLPSIQEVGASAQVGKIDSRSGCDADELKCVSSEAVQYRAPNMRALSKRLRDYQEEQAAAEALLAEALARAEALENFKQRLFASDLGGR